MTQHGQNFYTKIIVAIKNKTYYDFSILLKIEIISVVLLKAFDSRIKNSNFSPRQKLHKILTINVIINIGQNQEIFALHFMVIYVNVKLQDIIFTRFGEKLDRKFQCDTKCRLIRHPIFLFTRINFNVLKLCIVVNDYEMDGKYLFVLPNSFYM